MSNDISKNMKDNSNVVAKELLRILTLYTHHFVLVDFPSVGCSKCQHYAVPWGWSSL